MKLSYRNASTALPDLCGLVLRYGRDIPSRNGGTKELTMLQVELTNPWPLEIVTPERNVSIAAQIAETMWVLSGRNDVEWLANYLPQAPKFSDDGETWRGGYGPRLRAFGPGGGEAPQVDQLEHVVRLLKEDPDTRRAVMAIYDPAIDTEPGKDIPCNNWLHFLARNGKLNLHVAIRSNDLMWGWSGINAFEWSALLAVVAGMTGLQRGSITFSISSLHLYERHYAKAERISRHRTSATSFPVPNPEFELPGLGIEPVKMLDALISDWFKLEREIREGRMTYTVTAEIDAFPEPMLRSWLQVLAAWWNPGLEVAALKGTSLVHALSVAPGPKKLARAAVTVASADVPAAPALEDFLAEADELHRSKDAAYGDSWCRRGEQMAIMANIARKVDRLGVDGGGDTSLDTAQDLMIYAAKYAEWLDAKVAVDRPRTGPAHCDLVEARLRDHATAKGFALALDVTPARLEAAIKGNFDTLEARVTSNEPRERALRTVGIQSAALAYMMWRDGRQAAEQEAATEAEFLGNTNTSLSDTKADQWRAENASRFFSGYNDLEGE